MKPLSSKKNRGLNDSRAPFLSSATRIRTTVIGRLRRKQRSNNVALSGGLLVCPPKNNIIEDSWFDARGMRRVYGRGDHFQNGRSFNMDIWRNCAGRLLARFWSRSSEVDDLSLEIVGISPNMIPDRKPDEAFGDSWIPQSLREEYDNWIISEC